MTIQQIQHLLAYLEYYKLPVDGQWGSGSEEACRAFQRAVGLEIDGIPGRATQAALRKAVGEGEQDEFWDGIRCFTRAEFACRRGCGLDSIDRRLVKICEQVRTALGIFDITSGLRCPVHNARVGGVANSRHLYGRAVDFSIRGKTAGQVMAFLESIPELSYCYAIDGTHVHMDLA